MVVVITRNFFFTSQVTVTLRFELALPGVYSGTVVATRGPVMGHGQPGLVRRGKAMVHVPSSPPRPSAGASNLTGTLVPLTAACGW